MSEQVRDPAPLTLRQAEIAKMVARGLSDKAIAREAGISVSTVAHHVQNAAERLPGPGSPRLRLVLWFFSLREDDSAA